MSDIINNKQTIKRLIQTVWIKQDLTALSDLWMKDCINHAMPGTDNRGLDLLTAYHKSLFDLFFTAFANVQINILQQIAETDRVVTYLDTRGTHTGDFLGIPATDKNISLKSMRIDRFVDGKISEHWSVADMAGLMQQLQA